MANIESKTGPLEDGLTPIQQEALDRLRQLFSGRATKEDVAALERWRSQNAEHAQAFELAESLFHLAGRYERVPEDYYRTPLLQRPLTRRVAMGGILVSTGAYAAVSPPLGLWPSLAELSSDYRTGVGEQRQIQLNPGVSIELNTSTSVSVRSRSNGMGIELVAGEVVADADTSNSTSFVAYAGNGMIVAKRASFDLRKLDNGFRAICLKGNVVVVQGHNQITLRENTGVTYAAAGGIGQPRIVNPVTEMAWRSGQLQFLDASLREIVAEINRYRPGRILIVNPKIADRRLNGIFWLHHLDDMANHLARMAKVSATTLPGGVILLS